jgi:hypothetical protein
VKNSDGPKVASLLARASRGEQLEFPKLNSDAEATGLCLLVISPQIEGRIILRVLYLETGRTIQTKKLGKPRFVAERLLLFYLDLPARELLQ